MSSGVYTILNTENGKVYVGATVDFKKRWVHHKSALRHNKHHNPHLQASWNKYGETAFEFMVCEYVEDKEQFYTREQHWLDFHRMLTEVYNYGPVACCPMLGMRHSKEHCRKIGKAHRNKIISEETRHRISETLSKSYPAFIHRDTGEIIPAGKNLEALCRERGLHSGNMSNLVHARCGRKRHRGWTLLEQIEEE